MRKKRILAMLLAVVMAALGAVPPIQVQAQETSGEQTSGQIYRAEVRAMENGVVDSGGCGDNVGWILDEDGTLTIGGSGAMWDIMWDVEHQDPLFFSRYYITRVIIEEGVTRIGNCAFRSCKNLSSVEIPESVTSIGSYTF